MVFERVEKRVLRHTVSFLYVLNIIFQAIFSLLFSIGVALLLGWASTTYWGFPDWVFVPLIIFGVIVGIISMIKFILAATRGLDNLERQHQSDREAEERGQSKNNEI